MLCVRDISKEEAERVVESVFDACFNDTEPFERIPPWQDGYRITWTIVQLNCHVNGITLTNQVMICCNLACSRFTVCERNAKPWISKEKTLLKTCLLSLYESSLASFHVSVSLEQTSKQFHQDLISLPTNFNRII